MVWCDVEQGSAVQQCCGIVHHSADQIRSVKTRKKQSDIIRSLTRDGNQNFTVLPPYR